MKFSHLEGYFSYDKLSQMQYYVIINKRAFIDE